MPSVKVRCTFCSKESGGKCSAKKNISVKTLKSRKCGKYQEDPDKVLAEHDKAKNAPDIPTYRHTWRYYDKAFGKKVSEDGPLFVRVR